MKLVRQVLPEHGLALADAGHRAVRHPSRLLGFGLGLGLRLRLRLSAGVYQQAWKETVDCAYSLNPNPLQAHTNAEIFYTQATKKGP